MNEEKVIIRQNSNFESEILALDPHVPESRELKPIVYIHDLNPYGMLLASLGLCTAVVLHTYAQYHDLDLQEVELTLEYQRIFAEDCKDCENINDYTEQIHQELKFTGDFDRKEYDKLLKIANQCPIHKIIGKSVKIQSQIAKSGINAIN